MSPPSEPTKLTECHRCGLRFEQRSGGRKRLCEPCRKVRLDPKQPKQCRICGVTIPRSKGQRHYCIQCSARLGGRWLPFCTQEELCRVKDLLRDHPSVLNTEIARIVNCSASIVAGVRKCYPEWGYQYCVCGHKLCNRMGDEKALCGRCAPRPPTLVPRICGFCSKEFLGNKNQKYHDRECQLEALRIKPPIPCEACGRLFRSRMGGNSKDPPRTCSRECGRWIRSKVAVGDCCVIPWLSCGRCGSAYIARNNNSRCQRCSLMRELVRLLKRFSRKCVFCGETLTGRASLYCGSHKCQLDAKQERKHRRRVSGEKQNRHKQDVMSLRAIAERDNWICHVCGEKVEAKFGNFGAAPRVIMLFPFRAGAPTPW